MRYNKTRNGIIMRKVFLMGLTWDVGIGRKIITDFGKYEYKRKYSVLRVWKRAYYRAEDWNGGFDEA